MKEKNDRKSMYMSILIAFVMISSAFAVVLYGFGDNSTSLRYNKYKFKVTNLGFETKIDGKLYYFDSVPQDVLGINVSSGIRDLILNGQAIIITSDPTSSYVQEIAVASYTLQTALSKMNKQAVNAFTKEGGKLPVFTCANATQTLPIIEIKESNTTEAIIVDNCITLYFSSGYDLQRLDSAVIYHILGVIDGQSSE